MILFLRSLEFIIPKPNLELHRLGLKRQNIPKVSFSQLGLAWVTDKERFLVPFFLKKNKKKGPPCFSTTGCGKWGEGVLHWLSTYWWCVSFSACLSYFGDVRLVPYQRDCRIGEHYWAGVDFFC